MYRFDLHRDAEAEEFCCEIIEQMIVDFGISGEEALIRMNQLWKGLRIEGNGLISTETPVYWAWHMYYGQESYWWIEGEERQKRQLPPLQPKPLP